jgi:hypothetical protein
MDTQAMVSNLKAAKVSLRQNFRSDLRRLDRAISVIRSMNGAETSVTSTSVSTPTPKRRRKISKAARLAISKAQQKRWAKLKAAKRKQ